MKIHSFISGSAAEAVARIRAELGPEAVVLNVRRLGGSGISRLWQKDRIEVLAHVPEHEVEKAVKGIEDLRQQVALMQEQFQTVARGERMASSPGVSPVSVRGLSVASPVPAAAGEGSGPLVARLLKAGVSADSASRMVALVPGDKTGREPLEVGEQLRQVAARLGPVLTVTKPSRTCAHVFVGVPGCGKTTALSKWLARTVLIEGRPASVWRLDGRVANVAESLSVYCDILGVPLQRHAGETTTSALGEALYIDLPGVNAGDRDALDDLKEQIRGFGAVSVHLVLNLAYDTTLLLAQIRAFEALGIEDLILTHLDEEHRWGKACDLVFGTNFPIRFLGAGQNVPGQFTAATVDALLMTQLARGQSDGR